MSEQFMPRDLLETYERGCLVPFTGSGMSRPACTAWPAFVSNLEQHAGIPVTPTVGGNLIQRAFYALEVLRRGTGTVAHAIRDSVYAPGDIRIPEQAMALASIYWPLICTTNYDDIYLKAKVKLAEKAEPVPDTSGKGVDLPFDVWGRSEADCRRVLQHLSFPASEATWALQGFLKPAHDVLGFVRPGTDFEALELELVVGHAEYRRAAHRAPHFRRCFAELFRTRSLLFLGSGLAEPYFLTLFDEIIELTGPPSRPHFAIIPKGDVDTEFMRRQYHVVCNAYEDHSYVPDFLNQFASLVHGSRARPCVWGFRLDAPARVDSHHAEHHFAVVRAGLPLPPAPNPDEVVAISCGRQKDETAASGAEKGRGRPKPSSQGLKMAGITMDTPYEWLDDWCVKWANPDRTYGIIAREMRDVIPERQDRRSPEAIRRAFYEFLSRMDHMGVRAIHVQLLAAGEKRAFQPWVSLIQMARAYGQWFRSRSASGLKEDVLRAAIYVVDPGLIAMLRAGHIDLLEHLEDALLRIGIEVVDAQGHAERYFQIMNAEAELGDVLGSAHLTQNPRLYAYPTPQKNFQPKRLGDIKNQCVREFGLVSGSTLVVDYRHPIGESAT